MTDYEMSGIFGRSRSLLITNVVADNRTVDIFVDERGTIEGIGEGVQKITGARRISSSTATGRSRSRAWSTPTPMRR